MATESSSSSIKLDLPPLLEVRDVVSVIHRSPDFVYKAINNGCLKAKRMGERKWMLYKGDVEKWIDGGMHTVQPEQGEADR